MRSDPIISTNQKLLNVRIAQLVDCLIDNPEIAILNPTGGNYIVSGNFSLGKAFNANFVSLRQYG